MADNVNTGAVGVPIATKERTSVHFQQYVLAGSAAASSGSYTVGITATAQVSANSGRRLIILQNLSTTTRVRYGTTAGLSTSSSTFIEVEDTLKTEFIGAIYLMADAGTVTVAYWEETN